MISEGRGVILPKVRDPRFVTIRRGGTLTDSDHHLLALWAASCAEHPGSCGGRHAMAAARDLGGAARHAAYAAGQAGAVAHVAAHELGAAAYAVKAAGAAAPEGEGEAAGRLECRWQRDQLPEPIRELVLDDQRLRNEICWSVFVSVPLHGRGVMGPPQLNDRRAVGLRPGVALHNRPCETSTDRP
jgi:hypothetical protein